jgi:hypothetical protein
MTEVNIHPASYRDPAGFVFQYQGQIYRQVNTSYAAHYDLLLGSGLYDFLVKKQWMLAHAETGENINASPFFYKTLLPEQLNFISYPYEWSFDMLKDAALLTLKINKAAIEHGMILKDASAFNVQFRKGRPVFIDSLSFEKYDEREPWIAYRQFCEMFLFPLYLEYYLEEDIKKILSNYIDGIPAGLTAKLLPWKSRFSLGVRLHVLLQNKISRNKDAGKRTVQFSKVKLLRLLDHLESIIQGLHTRNALLTTWSDYYTETILSKEYLDAKTELFRSFTSGISFATALDLGANDGYFSRLLSAKKTAVVAVDFDSACINRLYSEIKKEKIENLLPLIVDISNPAPAAGFSNRERASFLERAQSDMVTALALIHHLVFTRNIPLALLAGFFEQLTIKYLLIEFVPVQDEKVQVLIKNKAAYHGGYDPEIFETLFAAYFSIIKKETIAGSERILYLMQKKNAVL